MVVNNPDSNPQQNLSQTTGPSSSSNPLQGLPGLYSTLRRIAPDPIFGAKSLFQADPRPVVDSAGFALGTGKINLTIGMLIEPDGSPASMQTVKWAAHEIVNREEPRTYLTQVGNVEFLKEMRKIAYGENSNLLTEELNSGRLISVQATGGGGALNTSLKFLRRLYYDAGAQPGEINVAVANLTWPNHKGIAEEEFFNVIEHRFWNPATGTLDLAGMIENIANLPPYTALMLQHCCHNPTGFSLGTAEWKLLNAALLLKQQQDPTFQVVIDSPYQGYGKGLEEDAQSIRMMAEAGLSHILAQSGSKIFNLYGERVGAVTLVLPEEMEAVLAAMRAAALENFKNIVRVKESNCPRGGVEQAGLVLMQQKPTWKLEQADYRAAIQKSRQLLSDELDKRAVPFDTSLIRDGEGMFFALPATKAQADKIRELGLYVPSITSDADNPGARFVFPHVTTDNADYIAAALESGLAV